MSSSTDEKEFVTYLVDLMQSVGPVYAKGMFGGHGIFLEGLMFALVADGMLYLKVDKETENEFRARELEAFTYYKKGKEFKMSYYQAPEEALEDSEEMNVWANKAYCAATRAASMKRGVYE
jgi:DNA transformation protein